MKERYGRKAVEFVSRSIYRYFLLWLSAIMPKTSSKKFRQKIRDIKVWLYANRDQPLKKLMGMLNLKLIGHYRYYGISFNGRMISNYKQQVRELLFKVLNRRSDRKSYTREGFIEMLKYYPLAMPKIYVSLF